MKTNIWGFIGCLLLLIGLGGIGGAIELDNNVQVVSSTVVLALGSLTIWKVYGKEIKNELVIK